MTIKEITRTSIETALCRKVEDIHRKPEYLWADGRRNHQVDKEGKAAVKAAVANCTLDFDLWKNLRNPALIGQHPIGLREIWEFYAAADIRKTLPDGTANHLSMPTPFGQAAIQFKRAVIVSTMLPLSQSVFEQYAQAIADRDAVSFDTFGKAWAETNQLLDEAVGKVAMELHAPGRAVVPMTNNMIRTICEQTVPPVRQGKYHGPCKGGNFPQKSVGVLTGLVQFGVSRITFLDQTHNGRVERFIGPIRSIVLFDTEDVVADDPEVLHLTETWREHMMAVSDFTDTRPHINRQRYCTYIPDQERSEDGCGLCLQYCPSGAVSSSAPKENGQYPETIKQQTHRFRDGHLQFNFARCLEERNNKERLYPDHACGHCLVICAARGNRRAVASNR